MRWRKPRCAGCRHLLAAHTERAHDGDGGCAYCRCPRLFPEPPRNVRVVLADGTVIPCELVYAGVDEESLHTWRAVTPVAVGAGMIGAQVQLDSLPARTAIVVEVIPGG